MANILSAAEAANVLRCDVTDAAMLQLLPLVDSYIKNGTGRDWTADTTIHPMAKAAAQMLLVMWYEDPGMLGRFRNFGQTAPLSFGLTAALAQLEALAAQYKTFVGSNGAGACVLSGAQIGDSVSSLIGLVGVTGDQHAAFESVITVADQIQQVASGDLSANWYRAYLISPESL